MAVNPWASRSDLLLSARQLSVLIAPYTTPVLTDLESPTTGALTIPDAFIPMGLHAKRAGGSLSNNQDINDIESHGHGTPTRQIPVKRTIALGFEPQETTRYNLEHYWGADWADVAHSTHGGVVMAVPELPLNQRYRVILLGKDDYNGDPIYLYWIGNKVNINKTDDAKLTDAEVISYPYTLNFQSEDSIGSPLLVGISGLGWDNLRQDNDTGFVSSGS